MQRGGLTDKLLVAGRWFERVTTWLNTFLIGICAAMMFLMMVLVSLSVVLRYVFGTSLNWSFEVVEYMMVGATFLALAYIQSRDQHLKLDYLFDRLPPGAQAAATVLTALISLCLFAVVTKVGWDYYVMAWESNIRSWTIARVPLWPVRLTVPVGAFAMWLRLLIDVTRSVSSALRRPAEGTAAAKPE